MLRSITAWQILFWLHLQCNELNRGHPRFFCQWQDELRTEFAHFGPNTWLGIDAKGNVKGDCDASVYGEMLFIFITEQAAQKFWETDNKNKYIIYKTKCGPRINTNMFTEWQPGRVQQIYLPKTREPGIIKTKCTKYNYIYWMTARNVQDDRK